MAAHFPNTAVATAGGGGLPGRILLLFFVTCWMGAGGSNIETYFGGELTIDSASVEGMLRVGSMMEAANCTCGGWAVERTLVQLNASLNQSLNQSLQSIAMSQTLEARVIAAENSITVRSLTALQGSVASLQGNKATSRWVDFCTVACA